MKHKTYTKRSKIWLMPKNKFEILVKRSNSIAEIIRFFGFAIAGRSYRAIRERIKKDKINCSHIAIGLSNRLGKRGKLWAAPLNDVMIKNSKYHYGHLKERLLKQNILKNVCDICGQTDIWKGKRLVMVMDHINGIRNDHRRENLRMLCPNCNSQTNTFSGRNK